MTDEITYHDTSTSSEALDGSPPVGQRIPEAIRKVPDQISRVIDAGKKPGMPLGILRNMAREAPLGSLLAAFMLGIAVARRK